MTTHFAIQSAVPRTDRALHAAIVPDGNGRWAVARGLPRAAGHRAGMEAVRRAVRAAPSLGIGTLTIDALSSDNWKRPRAEVQSILGLIAEFLLGEVAECRPGGVRMTVIGRRDRLPEDVRRAIESAERATAAGSALHLRLAVDYSSRDAILAAAEKPDAMTRATVSAALGADGLPSSPVPDLDLLIRTGGEVRLGDFLLWESVYAELVFLSTPWPDFVAADLAAAVAEYQRRERRFGGLAAQPVRPAEIESERKPSP
jgi:undecaprenyl diphosphate synthase